MKPDFSKMIRAQNRMAEINKFPDIKVSDVSGLVAVDAAYSKRYGGVSVAVCFLFPKMRQVGYSVSIGEPSIPYVPGLLAFREAPLFYAALSRALNYYCGFWGGKYVILVDGHGIAHPRKAGIATHIGLALKMPSVGIAKRRLYGIEASENGRRYLVDETSREKIALVVSRGRKKLYISPGAFISLKSVEELIPIILSSSETYLPLPLHKADALSKQIARDLDRARINLTRFKDCLLGKDF